MQAFYYLALEAAAFFSIGYAVVNTVISILELFL